MSKDQIRIISDYHLGTTYVNDTMIHLSEKVIKISFRPAAGEKYSINVIVFLEESERRVSYDANYNDDMDMENYTSCNTEKAAVIKELLYLSADNGFKNGFKIRPLSTDDFFYSRVILAVEKVLNAKYLLHN